MSEPHIVESRQLLNADSQVEPLDVIETVPASQEFVLCDVCDVPVHSFSECLLRTFHEQALFLAPGMQQARESIH